MTKSKVYTKSHNSEKAAKGHMARIKKRGGSVTSEKKDGKIIFKYNF
jgi:hypothetical protein